MIYGKMSNKVYKERLADHATPEDVSPCTSYNYFTGTCNAYLDCEAEKELRQDVKSRKEAGETVLPGSNNKATYRKNAAGEVILTSYYTDVVKIGADGYPVKLWKGFSVTTLNHINEFLSVCGFYGISKRAWIAADPGDTFCPAKKNNKGV